MTQYYKVLTIDRRGTYSDWQYPEIGVWTPKIEGELVECRHGYHVVTAGQLLAWIGPRIHPVDVGGLIQNFGGKHATNQIRLHEPLDTWNDRTAAADAAWDVAWSAALAADAADVVNPPRSIRLGGRLGERAARDVAWSAAVAARAAAGLAATDAWDAARAALDADPPRRTAGGSPWRADAEHRWLTDKLMEYLEITSLPGGGAA